MNRKAFMQVNALVAFVVGGIALIWPRWLLASKGVELGAAVSVWMREVGVMILAVGMMSFRARTSTDPVALRAVLLGSAMLHAGLFPIELAAYWQGVITKASGVVPNSVLHVALALGSLHFARATARAASGR